MVHKVKLGYGLFLAIITKYLRANTGVLFWHLLTGHELVDPLKEVSHVAKALQADGTLIRVARVLLVAYEMDGVPAWHKHDGCCSIKQILPAYGATAL